MIVGGIAFENPSGSMQAPAVDEWKKFILYENYEAITEGAHLQSASYLLYFTGSVRGLSIGAPVELKGIKLGQVTEIKMEYDPDTKNVKIPVTVLMQMNRITVNGVPDTNTFIRNHYGELLDELVQQGLRAQLQTGNYVTGQLLVDLNFYPDVSPTEINWETNPLFFQLFRRRLKKFLIQFLVLSKGWKSCHWKKWANNFIKPLIH